ncbi:hypothetical protein HIM_09452 [Hirsutella minnesotensis 3608]|uniref:Uncharacterized protein n=1 Tax=Hirsutella minnesotensis 3608 TaxID=1043627 RepID=A0A0F7ZSD1_9HYPO|nr:hypothetical protein HIM_09452 [Hirsutella minnesotensis 3608]
MAAPAQTDMDETQFPGRQGPSISPMSAANARVVPRQSRPANINGVIGKLHDSFEPRTIPMSLRLASARRLVETPRDTRQPVSESQPSNRERTCLGCCCNAFIHLHHSARRLLSPGCAQTPSTQPDSVSNPAMVS